MKEDFRGEIFLFCHGSHVSIVPWSALPDPSLLEGSGYQHGNLKGSWNMRIE